MDVNDNFTQSVHQAQMDRIAELEAERDEYYTTCKQLDSERNRERDRAEQAEAELASLKADTTVLISAIWESTGRLLNRCAEKGAK